MISFKFFRVKDNVYEVSPLFTEEDYKKYENDSTIQKSNDLLDLVDVLVLDSKVDRTALPRVVEKDYNIPVFMQDYVVYGAIWVKGPRSEPRIKIVAIAEGVLGQLKKFY